MSVYLVSREAVLDILQDLRENDPFPEYRTAIREIERMPSVESEPVVHAHWVKNWCDNNLIGHEYEECSACGCSMLDTNQFWDSKRCPNCGAHMDEEVAK